MANQSPHIGSPDFFKSIIASIRDATNDKFPLDMVILQSLLLCVIARDKHVILRTSPEDLTLVCRLVSLVRPLVTNPEMLNSAQSAWYTVSLRSVRLPVSQGPHTPKVCISGHIFVS